MRANYDQEIEKLVSTAATLGVTRIGWCTRTTRWASRCWPAFKAAMAKFNLTPSVIATTPGTISPEVDAAVQGHCRRLRRRW